MNQVLLDATRMSTTADLVLGYETESICITPTTRSEAADKWDTLHMIAVELARRGCPVNSEPFNALRRSRGRRLPTSVGGHSVLPPRTSEVAS